MPLLRGHLCQSLADRVALAQDVVVVVEEEEPDHLDPMGTLLQLRQDHLAQLVRGGVSGCAENVGDLHDGRPPAGIDAGTYAHGIDFRTRRIG